MNSYNQKILIVDDIFDTGRTVSSVISLIKEHRKQGNDQFKIAVPWYKPKNNLTDIFPDFYIHETEKFTCIRFTTFTTETKYNKKSHSASKKILCSQLRFRRRRLGFED